MSPVNEIRIRSLGELVDSVTPARPDPRSGRWRDAGVYRGAANGEGRLYTSLDRLGGLEPAHSNRELESHILRNYIRYARPHLGRGPVDDWEHLVSAQHHGVPTRLLDWTYSPLVAAYFATRPTRLEDDYPRAVWRLDWRRMHRKFEQPELSLLMSDLAALNGDGDDGHFTPWDLFERDPAAPPFAALLEPPSLDARIVAQAAVFTLTSDTTRPFDAFLEQHGLTDVLTRYVIEAADVARIRDQLDLVGVDERRLFPDLDGVAAALRRYYE
jgi:hypothetical protein